jgi:hypothetical protein
VQSGSTSDDEWLMRSHSRSGMLPGWRQIGCGLASGGTAQVSLPLNLPSRLSRRSFARVSLESQCCYGINLRGSLRGDEYRQQGHPEQQ